MLAVVKLPGEAAMEMLRQKLGGVARRHEPADLHGYPVFEEEGGAVGKVFYGVGGGYLFVADDAAVLGDSLGRLAARSGLETPEAPPSPSLSADPVFRRGVPEAWEDVGLALFVRKSQQFARWDPSLRLLDDYLSHAFVLAPADDGISLSAVRISGGPDFEVRSSITPRGAAEGEWADLLPGGMSQAVVGGPPGTPASRASLLAGVETFRGKRIWKSADELLRDTPRLRTLVEGALGPGAAPEDEVLRRLPRDAAMLGEAFCGALERAALAPAPSFCYGTKNYEEGGLHAETVMGARFGPVESFLLAAALDMVVDRQEEWLGRRVPRLLERAGEPGFLAWRVPLDRIVEGLEEEEARSFLEPYRRMAPSLVLSGGNLWLTLGDGIHRDLRALAAGRGSPLSADPLFVEALAAVPAHATLLEFTRPGEVLRGTVGGLRGQFEPLLREAPDPGIGDLFEATVAGFEEVILWQRGVRATVAASYADPEAPSESVSLLDPREEKAHPRLVLDPAALLAPDLLPAGTFALAEGRLEVRPASDAFVAAFLRGLPGGRDRWDELRAGVPLEPGELEDRLEALLVDMKGEAGIAMVVPPVPGDGEVEGTQDLIDRIPGFVLFAGYARPDRAFDQAAGLLDLLEESFRDRVPYEARWRAFQEGRGPLPVGAEVERTGEGGRARVDLRVFWPEGRRGGTLSAGAAVVRRGDLLFLTTSLPVADAIADAEPGAPGTFGERMGRELPPGTLPAACNGFTVLREDGFADGFSLFARPLAPGMAGLTLAGSEGRPPRDRILAHQAGWTEVADLLDDLFRTGRWRVGAMTREGDRLHTVTRRVAGR